ncbi:TolC family protein [Sulfuritalea sp.]|uniref:TolC family protein n=1 Tax=Sulfuritalea sp. TaxID=2480090 RepID=UPI00286E4DBC|nr:TolC family protein [Sulfuritalea sp.]
MMIRLLLIGLLTICGNAQAVQPANPPGLLPTKIARPLLEQDPGVAAARAGLDVALHDAGILDKSPYEWTTRATGQQRRLESGPRYNEWNVGVERTIRLPGKAAADRDLGKATIEESQARHGEALHEAARELMALWVDWLAAERARELAENSLQSAQASLAAVEKRVRAGDASKLDLSIARAELADQRRMDNDAKTQAFAAWSRLSTRFPGVKHPVLALPAPLPIGEDAAFWRARILAQSDELKVVQTQMRMAQAHAERARADKTPDPTLGVYTASEAGGTERIGGIMISIPIPGGARDSRSAKAIAAVEVSRQEVELKRRQLETTIASAVATARGAYDSLQIANEGAAAMRENAGLMQRAYALGEAELQALLLARRQASTAMNNALQAQVTALKAYYGLLVDAHLIWDLDHD